MTTIYDNSIRYNVTADGHAGDSTICTAISTLMYTLDENLRRAKIITTVVEEAGYFDILAFPNLTQRSKAASFFKTIVTGLEHLAIQFPDNVKIVRRGETDTNGNNI